MYLNNRKLNYGVRFQVSLKQFGEHCREWPLFEYRRLNIATATIYQVYVATALPSCKQHSHKITKVKQLGSQLALGWVAIEGFDVNAVAAKYCKIQG